MQSPNQIPEQMELEVTCYLSRRDSGRTSCYTGEALLTKQFCIEIEVCGSQDSSCTSLSTTVCRKCREALLQEFAVIMPCLRREERRQQVDFLLKHRPREKASSFRVVALFDRGTRELYLPREEESCPLCKFALSPFDRASSLSEQSLSRIHDPRGSPPAYRRDTLRRTPPVGDAPFAAQVTPQGDVVPRKPRAPCARQDFVSPSDLQVTSDSGLHRHVSLTVSNFKYNPLSSSYPHRAKSHRSRSSFIEEDYKIFPKHRSRHSSSQPPQVKSCRVM